MSQKILLLLLLLVLEEVLKRGSRYFHLTAAKLILQMRESDQLRVFAASSFAMTDYVALLFAVDWRSYRNVCERPTSTYAICDYRFFDIRMIENQNCTAPHY